MDRMRNKDLENAWAVQLIRQEKCAKLEEENKKLKEGAKLYRDDCKKLREENKNLKEEIEDLKKIRDGKDDYIRDLEEKNYELETEIVRLHQEAEYYGVKL